MMAGKEQGEEEFSVEKVIDKRIRNGKVSKCKVKKKKLLKKVKNTKNYSIVWKKKKNFLEMSIGTSVRLVNAH